MSQEKNEFGLSAREQEILSNVFVSLKSAPDVDYVKLAGLCGMSNPRSASNAFTAIKKKLWPDGLPNAAAATPKKAAATTKKSKPNAAGSTGSDEPEPSVDSPPATPAPKKRARQSKSAKEATATKTEDSGSGSGSGSIDTIPVTPVTKVTPRKRKTAIEKKAEQQAEGGSPPKKARATKKKSAEFVKEESEAETEIGLKEVKKDGEDEIDVMDEHKPQLSVNGSDDGSVNESVYADANGFEDDGAIKDREVEV
ncbi:hypothetical protein EJ05DRAFT_44949 [Pseudovirgaria hyperparasitica]|uniref:Uncharacterized protein n=1 Tax=Pseudovirgaria hyperparasitica TaxID=470096 RepID=A0A6A6W2L5_9PEZI|nr:uncharacterized protein EJ05DRAFT_44949 [Pseudovirgaria hyperparasitica]KAF2756823.1 hypothetical protein EJ05DRAFT_44949 [Pseudovirgaria hyperparasitica]